MAYVPPALRKQQHTAATGEKSANNTAFDPFKKAKTLVNAPPSIADIVRHFWPDGKAFRSSAEGSRPVADVGHALVTGEGKQQVADDDSATDQDRHNHKVHSTLNSTEASPNELRFVLLFHQAHQRWKSEKIIYAKSELHLLPSPTELSEPQSSETRTKGSKDVRLEHTNSPSAKASKIAVFEQDIKYGRTFARFKFVGYYDLTRMNILEPHTPELARMLEQKWTVTNRWGESHKIERDAASWQKSLSYKWAVLQFAKSESGDDELSPPNIVVREETTRSLRAQQENTQPRRGVNDMLRDMRLENGHDSQEQRPRHT